MTKKPTNTTWVVYRLKNTQTGRSYYGCTKQPEKRRVMHIQHLLAKEHYNKPLQDEFVLPKFMEYTILKDGILNKKEALALEKELANEDPTSYNKNGVKKEHNSTRNHLTEELVLAIRNDYAREKVTQQELARRYGVSQGNISGILTRRIWSQVGGPEYKPNFHGTTPIDKKTRHKVIKLWLKHRRLDSVEAEAGLNRNQIRAIILGRPEMPIERGKLNKELTDEHRPLYVDGEWYKNASHARLVVGRSMKLTHFDDGNGLPHYTSKLDRNIKHPNRIRPPVVVDDVETDMTYTQALAVYKKLIRIKPGKYLTEKEYATRELVHFYPKLLEATKDPICKSGGENVMWLATAREFDIPRSVILRWKNLNEEDMAQVAARFAALQSKRRPRMFQAKGRFPVYT